MNLKLGVYNLSEVLTLTLFLEFVASGSFLATEILKENSSDAFLSSYTLTEASVGV